MLDLHRTFISESAEKLGQIIEDLEKGIFNRPEIFRTLHTLKGTAQTLSLNESSRLAHHLENIISLYPDAPAADSQTLMAEGLKLLIRCLKDTDFRIPGQFLARLPQKSKLPEQTAPEETLRSKLPENILSGLSATEKTVTAKALAAGRQLFCLEVIFEQADFTAGLKNFRKILGRTGEIIATFPGRQTVAPGQIGFQILLASELQGERIRHEVRDFSVVIVFDSTPQVFPDDLSGILAQITNHGLELARKFDKQIEFDIKTGSFELSAREKKIVFEILLHLVRNACDHAFEKSGKIEIDLRKSETGLSLRFSDDGKGLEPEKIRRRAVELGLLSDKDVLTRKATLELIFQSEFSTAPEVSEISGRGIGLDAVRDLTEKMGGQIAVTSRIGHGTIFEIFLEREK